MPNACRSPPGPLGEPDIIALPAPPAGREQIFPLSEHKHLQTIQAHETQTNHASHNPVVALGASPVRAQSEMPQPVVRAIMFWMAGCPYCEDVIQNVLPPLRVKYDAQFDLLMLEVVDTQDVDMLYRAAASYNIPKEQTGVPFIIIGDRVLIGSAEVREQLPALIDDYLTRGGMDWPANPVIANLLPTASPASFLTSDPSAISTESAPTESDSVAPHDNGFTLAIAVMIVIASSLLYSVVSFAIGLPTVVEFLKTGLVSRIPSAVLAASLMVIAVISLTAGIILDSVARAACEQKRLFYLIVPRRKQPPGAL